MQPPRLSILGVGLLGGSIGLALKSVSTAYRIIGYGHRPENLQRALAMGAVDEVTSDLIAAVTGSELIILCTPVGTFRDILSRIAPALAARTIVTDVGSTKRSVVAVAAKLLAPDVHFVGSHPMAGSEKRGVEFARADLFKGSQCIVTPTDSTHPPAVKKIEEFWTAIGSQVIRLSPEDHDRLAADISHVPHAVAAALVAMQSEEALKLAGRGFRDTTRIASGDGGLWRDILLDNQDNIRRGIDRLQKNLATLLARLDEKDADGVKQWLDAATNKRENWARQKLQELNPE